jgi:hypothetical protein
MRKPVRSLALFVVASALIAAAACTDLTAPEPEPQSLQQAAPEQNALLGGLLDPILGILKRLINGLIAPVTRTLSLERDITWSFVAGPEGAVSSNSRVGLTISVPRGALTTTKVITVTALAGAPIAYTFQPHGLVFQRPVTLRQSLSGTSGYGARDVLAGAYFKTDRLVLNENGLAEISELLPAQTNFFTKTVTFQIEHFSGYILASGRSVVDRDSDEEGR